MKKITMISALVLMFLGFNTSAQTFTIIDPAGEGGFELGETFEDNGWAVNNATYGSRKWQIGAAQPGYTGERAAFIGSSSTTVGTSAGSRTVHLYRPVTVPADAVNILLTFKYKQEIVVIDSETGPNDYIYLSLLDEAPATGTTPTSSQFGEKYPNVEGLPDFTEFTVSVPAELAGAGEKMLVITFRSNNLSDPATIGWGAIDDIALTYDIPCDVAAPTASAQDFCTAGTVGDLSAEMTGTGTVVWYDVATDGTVLTDETALATGSYYAAVADGDCESERIEVAVTVTVADAPTGEATQNITAGTAAEATLEDITVTATGTVTWYASQLDAENGDAPLSSTTQLMNGATYYATQTIGECTSEDVFAVTVSVTLGAEDFVFAGFKAYPNPVKGVLHLTAQNAIDAVAVNNMLGQQVLYTVVNSNEVNINMEAVPQGTYMVTVQAGNSTKTIKVIK